MALDADEKNGRVPLGPRPPKAGFWCSRCENGDRM